MNAKADLSERDRSLFSALSSSISGEVDSSLSARALFASDASNYRIVPLGVVFPRSEEDVLATLAKARDHGVSIVQRGGGTSTGGQAVGSGIVIDYSRFFDHVVAVDPAARLARVQPGVVLDELQRQVAGHGLRFGPDPSTHDRCTIGGMIGNNACGAHSLPWGKTDENVIALRAATYSGEVINLSTLDELANNRSEFAVGLSRSLKEFLSRYESVIRTEMGPPMPRRVSGYGLGHLLPERGGSLAGALVGTEGTCVALLEATLKLVAPPRSRVLVVLGFPDLYIAADFVPELLVHRPLTIEGLDARLVALARNTSAGAGARLLPAGKGWLLLEIGGDTPFEARHRADELVREVMHTSVPIGAAVAEHLDEQRAIWRLREDGAGLATRLPDGSEAWPGFEDAAVPPEHLGDYLRGFDALLAEHGRQGMHYGHYGEGCMHIRIDFDFLTNHGRRDFRRFIEAAADLVVSFGGSLSGEHGDGQARSELLGKMYPRVILEAFAKFKQIFDPFAQMNPGRVVAPRALDADLRIRIPVRTINQNPHLALEVDHGDLERSARRCVGVGKCRRLDGGAMCPSFQVTRNERDSTRGRARLLSEMFAGDLIVDGWRSKEVRDALDLCLSCKACASDCPVGVDMASYKAEFLSHHYERRLRPRSHYALGYLPVLARRTLPIAGFANRLLASPFAPLAKFLGGIDQARELPKFAKHTLQGIARENPDAPGVILFPDTFTNYFSPEVGEAALAVLGALGEQAVIPSGEICCGLTWYSTGQFDRARAALRATITSLGALSSSSSPIVVLEPSCASMMRDEITELFAHDDEALAIASRVCSLGEHVAKILAQSPSRPLLSSGDRYLAQVHCHQRATTGYADEEALLRLVGADLVETETSCCGLAGNFGFEKGHYALSRAIGERSVLSRIARAEDDGEAPLAVVADGFSCRTQIAEFSSHRPRHLAQILRDALCVDGTPGGDRSPE
ncbi:MAG TPA: FAD-binding and (Fe-S)-binding domain-containing protein [Acidimicrobiales bacterium]|nr:FAD-binding and (Fe-S)-binding domain-containing protein [Acidimicrobiales bacterium]